MSDVRKKPGPRTSDIIKRDENVMGNPLKIRFYPMVIEEATGVTVKDPDGFEYIDFTGNWAVANVGYNHPEVLKAIKEQLEKTSFVSLCTFSNEVSVKLAEKLIEITPGNFKKRVLYGLSGSDANECVFKIIPKYTGKTRFIAFIGAYHGQTMGALSLSGHQAQAKFLGFPGVTKVPYPYCYRCPFKMETLNCDLYCLSFIEDIILKSVSPAEETAGIVVEPIQCDGGDIVPPKKFLPALQKLCRKYGICLVVDEVKVGFGRTGSMFAVQNTGVEPDVLVLGKPIASGIPLSACVARAEIFEAYPASHLFTTGGNPVSCAASLATIKVIEKNKLHENARRTGEFMMKRLKEMMERHKLIGDVRGEGLLIGIELVKDRNSKAPAKKECAKLCYRAWELGLLVEYVGLLSNVIEITPPLILTQKQADVGLEIFEKALSDVETGKVPDEKIIPYAGW
jgi:4-aminobutyrate aminotransferase